VKSTAWNFDRKMAWKTGKTSVSERTHDYISNRCFTYIYMYIYIIFYIMISNVNLLAKHTRHI
jgi:hypothetical protein